MSVVNVIDMTFVFDRGVAAVRGVPVTVVGELLGATFHLATLARRSDERGTGRQARMLTVAPSGTAMLCPASLKSVMRKPEFAPTWSGRRAF